MVPNRPTVFISYAHEDLRFTERLALALEMYTDPFWDHHLDAGRYPKQLRRQIDSREFFIFVMSPDSVVIKWCKRELRLAEKKGDHNKIVLALRPLGESVAKLDFARYLKKTYTYGDFT